MGASSSARACRSIASARQAATPPRRSPRLRVTLVADGRDVEKGRADIVLDGPLNALRLWVDAMAAQPQQWPIGAGDIVTTGTITDAAPLVAAGVRWQTRLSDPRLRGDDARHPTVAKGGRARRP